MQLAKKILKQLNKAGAKPQKKDQIFSQISAAGATRADFEKTLRILVDEGKVVSIGKGFYQAVSPENRWIGTFAARRSGHGFVALADGDIQIPADKVHGAMHGDTVRLSLSKRRGPGGSRTGQVTDVLERVNKTLVGRFERRRNYGIVVPANDRITYEFMIRGKEMASANTGDIVEIEVVRWPRADQMPRGEVRRVIGQETEPGMDITMIVLAHNWPEEFTPQAIKESESAPREVQPKAIEGRLDLRDKYTVTIDGLDAKDFDDAISLEVGSEGNFKLGVHIADVSHYVTLGSGLDQDARARTTSVYLPDRVIPMLPNELSTGICSLNPDIDRLAFSVLMDIDPDGNVTDYKIGESVIRSDARLTYEEVDRHLTRGFYEDERLDRLLRALDLLSKLLDKKRLARGSLNFETVEPKLILDESGKPLEILIRERSAATQLIEETMILTNETVAEFMLEREAPMIFRIHDRPDPDAVIMITRLIEELGYPLGSLEGGHPRAFQALIDYAHDRPERLLINSLMLRAMSRAKYSPNLVSHFGLAAPHYSHFTSPIRRYPDLLAHRLIKATLAGKLGSPAIAQLIEELDELAQHCSRQEREAEAADREATEVKVAEFMVDKVGETYPGVITGVTNFGLFVQVENTAEGLVHIRSLGGDYYQFDAQRHLLRGERTGQVFRLGQAVTAKLVNVSVPKRQLDFVLVK